MFDLDLVARLLHVDVAALRWNILALPSWTPTPSGGHPCVRVTVLARGRHLRARVVEADTEAAALARLCAEGVPRG